MNVRCPECSTLYRVDPEKVPEEGVNARCARCPAVFAVEPQTTGGTQLAAAGQATGAASRGAPAESWTAPTAATGVAEADEGDAEEELPPAPFGSADPHERARRLARALVSDIAAYHGDRRDRSLREGTLRHDLRDEIRKSWDEYTGQVGNQIARETSYFRDALNEILARGERLF